MIKDRFVISYSQIYQPIYIEVLDNEVQSDNNNARDPKSYFKKSNNKIYLRLPFTEWFT